MEESDLTSIYNEFLIIETELDKSLKEQDFDTYNLSLDKRMKLFIMLDGVDLPEYFRDFFAQLKEKDNLRRHEIEKLKAEVKAEIEKLHVGKNATKHGYYNVNEEMIRKKFDNKG